MAFERSTCHCRSELTTSSLDHTRYGKSSLSKKQERAFGRKQLDDLHCLQTFEPGSSRGWPRDSVAAESRDFAVTCMTIVRSEVGADPRAG
jgi:hypothetical protein